MEANAAGSAIAGMDSVGMSAQADRGMSSSGVTAAMSGGSSTLVAAGTGSAQIEMGGSRAATPIAGGMGALPGTASAAMGTLPIAGMSAATGGDGSSAMSVMCPSGTKQCQDACIGEASCCTAMDCAPGSTCEDRICRCPVGQHVCGSACASDVSPDSCGSACMPCPRPMGGEAQCVSGACQPKCPSGTKICLGDCIAEDHSCQGQCPSGTHDCSGNCVDNMSSMTCGTSCSACPTPSGGTATCDGSSCGIRCSGSTPKVCGDRCAAECCGDTDCSGNDKCVNGSCECQRQCSGRTCGSDGCFGQCGTCQANSTCTSSGQCECQKRCDGTRCGANTDGCGGACNCAAGQDCISGQCKSVAQVNESCMPDSSNGQGNCMDGYRCVGIGGTGTYCYLTTDGSSRTCGSGYFPAGGQVCLVNCDPTSSFNNCPSHTHCIANGETGGSDPTIGYCVAP